jgi:hypothetical protein
VPLACCFDFDEGVVAPIVVVAAASAIVVDVPGVVGAGAHDDCIPVLVGTAHLERTRTRLPNVVDGAANGDSHWHHPVDPLPLVLP